MSDKPTPAPRKVIPIRAAGSGPNKPVVTHFHWQRRAVQIGALLLAVLIPAVGLLRIDPMAGAFVVLDRQIWLADFFVIGGLWVLIVSLLVLIYSTVGTVFCGWVCPQNTMSEWANLMTSKLLGKRATLSLTGNALVVAAGKNKALNWLLLIGSLLAASMALALIPLFYFYPPEMIWSFITFRDDPAMAASLHWIYAFAVVITFLDIAMLRHFWCRFACIYRMWQHSFKTRQTLHVDYDASRSADCAKCNYCVTSCFLDLDPRQTDVYSSCINCGECIDACNRLHVRQGEPGLLSFALGKREAGAAQGRNAGQSLFTRVRWTLPFTLLGLAMFSWGLHTYEPYHVAVSRSEAGQGEAAQSYRIAVANKMYHDASFSVEVRGLPPGSYRLDAERLVLGPVGRESVTLDILPTLDRHGLVPFVVEVQGGEGWTGRFPVQHFAK